jgi:hypothetical protein
MKPVAMEIIEVTSEVFRKEFLRLVCEHPGAELRVTEDGKILSRMILPAGGKPKGWPEAPPLLGDGPSASEFVCLGRD